MIPAAFITAWRRTAPWNLDAQVEQDLVISRAIIELLSTKMRALYQRKKGRDLFDLWFALQSGKVNIGNLISCFQHYMRKEGHTVTRAQFEKNLDDKRRKPDFRDDVSPLLHSSIEWNFDQAMNEILHTLISKLSGNTWKG